MIDVSHFDYVRPVRGLRYGQCGTVADAWFIQTHVLVAFHILLEACAMHV